MPVMKEQPPMADPVALTFAEVEFLLRAGVPAADLVRGRLHLRREANAEVVAAAGVSSLLARGLCTQERDDVRPGNLVLGAVAALSTVHTVTEVTGQVDGHPVVLILFTGDIARLAVVPRFLGQFGVEVTSSVEALSGPLTRFLARASAGTGEVAVVARSTTVDGGERISLAVARDAAGQWYESDTLDSPDRGRAMSHGDVVRRIGELFGAAPVGVAGR
jgi:hypothetical protein